MTGAELFELFVAPGILPSEILGMDIDVMTQQIHELRQDDPDDDIAMSDNEIAEAILEYAEQS